MSRIEAGRNAFSGIDEGPLKHTKPVIPWDDMRMTGP